MDENDIETMVEDAFELIAEIASSWQDDTPTDEVARAIIGSSNPIFNVMEKLIKEGDFSPNPHVMMIMVELSYAQITSIKKLDALGELKKEGKK